MEIPDSPTLSPADSGPTRINTVTRAARLLTLVGSLPVEQRTASRLAQRLGTSIPSTHHMLSTLVDAGLLYRDDAKRYYLGLHIGLLGEAYRRQNYLPPELLVELQKLASSTGESAYFSVWREGTIQIVAKLAGSHAVQVANLEPGFEGGAHARASGKVLLAYTDEGVRQAYLALHPLVAITDHTITDAVVLERELQRVRRNGYATEEREFAPDVACVAVPVLVNDSLLGAYTLSAPFSRYRRLKRSYVDGLLAAADAVTRSFDAL